MQACGIDFGTSNSSVAFADAGEVRLLAVEEGSDTLPTALFFPAAKEAKPLFGRAAQKAFFEGEEGRFMRSLKRLLGTALMEQGTVVNGKPRAFPELIGHFVSHLKGVADKAAGGSVSGVVMGRPVHFLDGDAAGDKRAEGQLAAIARAAGFAQIEFQYEPVAAAFAHERNIEDEKCALVADIGGGTSDFTAIRVSRRYMSRADRAQDILGHSGLRLGGNDFDKSLSLACFMPELGYRSLYGAKRLAVPLNPFHDLSEWSKVNFLYTPKFRAEVKALLAESHDKRRFGRFARAIEKETGHRVLSAVETAKIDLTSAAAARAPLDFLEADLALDVPRAAFEDAIRAHITRLSETVSECLRTASLADRDVETVILTGGPTETPLLRALFSSRFPNAPVSEENKLSSVALGLGFDAKRKFG
jgi:hypothetical chaperone protein